jgi:HEPN domain-containing protein
MNNLQKAQTWLKMAEEDYKDAKIDLNNFRFPSTVFHTQQCCEKVGKAVLAYLGIEAGKTHFPTTEIELMVLRGNPYKLEEGDLKILSKIVSLAKVLESQKEFPRYGWETRE